MAFSASSIVSQGSLLKKKQNPSQPFYPFLPFWEGGLAGWLDASQTSQQASFLSCLDRSGRIARNTAPRVGPPCVLVKRTKGSALSVWWFKGNLVSCTGLHDLMQLQRGDYATFQLSTQCYSIWSALIFQISIWLRAHRENPLSIRKSKKYFVVMMIGEILFQAPSQQNQDIWTPYTWARQRGRVYLFLQKLPLQLTAVTMNITAWKY